MACLSSAQIAAIKEEIADIDEMIVIVKGVYLEALKTGQVEEYRFDSGDGNQKTIYRNLKDVKSQWDELRAERAQLVAKLTGGGIVSFKMRRVTNNGRCY